MSTLNVYSSDLFIIHEFFQYPNVTLLFHVNKEQFLARLLTKHADTPPVDFYSKWFSCFMGYNTVDIQANSIDSTQFNNLLREWIKCLLHGYHIFIHIFQEFNRLSSSFIPQENNPRFLQFTDKLIDLFFQKGKFHFFVSKSFRIQFIFREYL